MENDDDDDDDDHDNDDDGSVSDDVDYQQSFLFGKVHHAKSHQKKKEKEWWLAGCIEFMLATICLFVYFFADLFWERKKEGLLIVQ